jgi:hypothetical protein
MLSGCCGVAIMPASPSPRAVTAEELVTAMPDAPSTSPLSFRLSASHDRTDLLSGRDTAYTFDANIASSSGRKRNTQPGVAPKHPIINDTVLTAAIKALCAACADKGGLNVLNEAATHGVATVTSFCDFCEHRLGVAPIVPITVFSLLHTSNDVVKVPKLVAMLKVAASALASADEAALASRQAGEGAKTHMTPETGGSTVVQGDVDDAVLDDLASVLDMGLNELLTVLPTISVTSMHDVPELISSLIMSEAKYTKLPQGLNAPFVPAWHRGKVQMYQVPVWSLRALYQKLHCSNHSSIGALLAPHAALSRRVHTFNLVC